jgi:hypothetical protein
MLNKLVHHTLPWGHHQRVKMQVLRSHSYHDEHSKIIDNKFFILVMENENSSNTHEAEITRIPQQILRGEGCDPLNRVKPAHFVLGPNQDLDYKHNLSWFFIYVQWVELRWEVTVRLVEIGGSDDYHCLNVLFIHNSQKKNRT